jgi:predicted metal-binding membrane protein
VTAQVDGVLAEESRSFGRRGRGPANRGAVLFTTAVLLVVPGLSWRQTVNDARRMSSMVDGLTRAGRAMPFDSSPVRFAAMWAAMIAAMMLPGIVPMVANRRDANPAHPLAGGGIASGYLIVWMPTAVAAFGGLIALNKVTHPSDGLNRAGGAIVVLAGVYQLTHWKRRLLEDQKPSAAGAFRVGLSEGLRCLGCSWALMSVLLVVGVMNIACMAVISAICMGEKTVKRRAALATGVGLVLIALGLATLIEPRMLDVIAEFGWPRNETQ